MLKYGGYAICIIASMLMGMDAPAWFGVGQLFRVFYIWNMKCFVKNDYNYSSLNM